MNGLQEEAPLLSLKPKKQHEDKRKPMTCLPCLYKLITSLKPDKFYDHCERKDVEATHITQIATPDKQVSRKTAGTREITSPLTEVSTMVNPEVLKLAGGAKRVLTFTKFIY